MTISMIRPLEMSDDKSASTGRMVSGQTPYGFSLSVTFF